MCRPPALEIIFGRIPVADATGKDVPASGLSSQQPAASCLWPEQPTASVAFFFRPEADTRTAGVVRPREDVIINLFSPEGGTCV